MKRTLRLTIAAFGLAIFNLSAVVVQAQDYTYTTNDGTITITEYTGPGGAVTIPSTINGLPVTSIGDYVFESCTSLTSVTIPYSVNSIGNVAFGFTSLTNVTIPGGVTSIGHYAFFCCTKLVAITVDAINPGYSSMVGVLFDKTQTGIIQCPGGKAGSYAIPNGVTRIEDDAFSCCANLTNVTIPDSVTSIGGRAFSHCTSLTSITVPKSVVSIGRHVFYYCTNVVAITVDAINSNYSTVDGVLFDKTHTRLIEYPGGKAGSYTIPNGVTSIGVSAFASRFRLTSVTIPNTVTNIGSEAFGGCTSLTSVTIPNSVTSIEDYAFICCSSLTAIAVDAINPVYSSLAGVLFDKTQTKLIEYPGGKAGSYAIPNGVTSIGVAAFGSCANLTNVTIPDSVTSIGGDAFNSCFRLTGVYFHGNAPGADWSVFDYGNATVYYLPGTTGWGTEFGGRPTAPWFLPNPMILNNDPGFGVQTNGFGFIISWATNASFVVEATMDLNSPTWSPVATNTLTDGSAFFSDPQWKNHPARFYRIRSP